MFRSILLTVSILGLCCASGPKSVIKPVEPAVSRPVGPDLDFLESLLMSRPAAPAPKPIEGPVDGEPYIPHLDLAGFINGDLVDHLVSAIEEANIKGALAIVVEIDSGGGEVDSGMALAKAIERSRAPVHCVVDGKAESMAFYVLQSCTTRTATWRSELMVHEPRLGGGRIPGRGTRADFKRILNDLEALTLGMNRHWSRRLNIPYKQFCDRIAAGEWFMDIEEGLAVKAVDLAIWSVPEMLKTVRDQKGVWLTPAKPQKKSARPKK